MKGINSLPRDMVLHLNHSATLAEGGPPASTILVRQGVKHHNVRSYLAQVVKGSMTPSFLYEVACMNHRHLNHNAYLAGHPDVSLKQH